MVKKDIQASYKLNVFIVESELYEIYDILETHIFTCTEWASVENGLLWRYASRLDLLYSCLYTLQKVLCNHTTFSCIPSACKGYPVSYLGSPTIVRLWKSWNIQVLKSWNIQVQVSGYLLFYAINCYLERLKWVAQSGRKHLTGDGLTYRNAMHMHISTRLNFGWTMPECVIIK